MGIRLSKRAKRGLLSLSIVCVFFSAFLIYIHLSLPDVRGLEASNPKETSLMKMRIQQAQIEGKTLKIRQNWVSFERIPDLFKNAVRITEDSTFYWHKGIDFDELKESIKKNIREKRLARGGSTITQQLAKNLYLSTEKSIVRKIKEYWIARRLEKSLSKDRIFELYLNVIEFGSGIFGVQEASQHYFKRDVSELNVEQIIRLTAIIPSPLTTDPTGKSSWLEWKCLWILDKLKVYKYINNEKYEEIYKTFKLSETYRKQVSRHHDNALMPCVRMFS
jgi:monofunctional biosynthetic peptidoglycan transglycosylase